MGISQNQMTGKKQVRFLFGILYQSNSSCNHPPIKFFSRAYFQLMQFVDFKIWIKHFLCILLHSKVNYHNVQCVNKKRLKKSADVCRADFYMHTKIGYPTKSQYAKIWKKVQFRKAVLFVSRAKIKGFFYNFSHGAAQKRPME